MIVYPSSSCAYTDDNTMASDERKRIFHKSLYQGSNIKLIPRSYHSSAELMLLFCLTLSMLILPLILPPLPPPPYLLLLLPIAILVVLVLLAVAPSNAKEGSYSYV